MKSLTTRASTDGTGQPVESPSEFRLDAGRVLVSRTKDRDLVLQSLPPDRRAALLNALEGYDEDFVNAVEVDRQSTPPMQDRDPL